MLTIIQNYTIEDVKNSINYLLEKAAYDEEVRQLAVQITYDRNPIAGVYDFIKTNVHYTPDPVRNHENIELFISPVKMVRDYKNGLPLAGDCDDQAILAVALYRSIGIRSNVTLLDTAGKGLDHAVANVYSDTVKKYIFVDPSSSEFPLGWEIQYYERIDV